MTVTFWAPVWWSTCRACPSGDAHEGTVCAAAGGDGHAPSLLQWHCAENEYSDLASLLHSGQEGLIKHLVSRAETDALPLAAVAALLAIYILMSMVAFGLAVPAGHFIPGLTMGAALGRVMGALIESLRAEMRRMVCEQGGSGLC